MITKRVTAIIGGWWDRMVRRGLSASQLAWLRGESWGGVERMGSPYAQSVWVQSAIKRVAQPIAAVPVVFRAPGGGESEVRPAELEGFLAEPAAGLDWSDCVEAFVGWLKLAGESFWVLDDEALAGRGAGRVRVIIARPDRMRHVVEGGRLKGWVYLDGAGRQHVLLPEQVIQAKNWNPDNEYRGASEWEAARVAAESAWLAGRFKRALMSNNGDTGPYIVAKSGLPTDAQREQILEELRRKREAQQRGEFRPIFLTGDIAVEDPRVRTVDAAFLAGVLEDRHEVYCAFGVPPSLADVKASYSIGSASDFYQLITVTCMPCGAKLCRSLERLARAAGLTVMAELDWDDHPVMQEVRKERLAGVDTLWSKGMPMRQISEYLGLGLPEYEGWDVGYLPFGVVPAGGETDAAEAAEYGEEDQDQEPEPVRGMKAALRLGPALESEMCGCGCGPGEVDTRRDAGEVARWRDLMQQRRGTIAAFAAKFGRELAKARMETLRKLEGAKLLAALRQKAAAADFVFDLEKFRKGLTAAMRGVAREALDRAGQQMLAELGKADDAWRFPPARAISFLDERENKITDVAEDIFRQITSTLQEGLDQGESIAELSARVREAFTDASHERARRIAMTETAVTYGVARDEAMREAGIEWKRWLTSGNSNVRSAHRVMNGQVVRMDERFTVVNPKTGEWDEVRFPGDPDGAAWNVINCHCVAVAETSGPEGEVE